MIGDTLQPLLAELQEKNLFRRPRGLSGPPGARVVVDGRELVNLASNDYLDLAGDPRVKAAAREAVDRYGAGATASRLMGGALEPHERLEAALAALKKTRAAVIFPSGYHANLGALQALLGPGDAAFLDRFAHASLVDGVRLSGATLRVFRHNDPDDLEKALRRRKGRRRWIVTESVFSMDGDAAPLCELAHLARQYDARLYVDEAHATGVFGPDGGGVVAGLGLQERVDVGMGTLSKALGAAGGFICGEPALIEWIHNRCRSFIYSTALPPATAAAALRAVEIARAEPERRARLLTLSRRLRDGLKLPSPPRGPQSEYERGPIIPLIVGGEEEALALSRRLRENGFFAPAVRPPTVPRGASRVRFSLTAGHTEADVDRLLALLS